MAHRTDYQWTSPHYTMAIHVTVTQHTQSATRQAYALMDLPEPLVEEAVFLNLSPRSPYQTITHRPLSQLRPLRPTLEKAKESFINRVLARVRQNRQAHLRLHVVGRAIVLVCLHSLNATFRASLTVILGDPCQTYDDCDSTNICGSNGVCVASSS